MSAKTHVRYAVVGAGNIAQVAAIPAFQHASQNSVLAGLVSGDLAKRAVLREKYGIQVDGGYDEFEKVLEDGEIDAVYVATPNTLHKEYAIRAAERGVHVLCEKPLAPTLADCREMAEACTANGVKLMVAYRLHFEEASLMAMEIARSGELGEVRSFSSVFSHVVRPGDIRLNAALAGGAAYDLGVYCINAARHVFEAEPISVFATIVEKDGIDDTTSALLTFPGGRTAQFTVSNGLAAVSEYRIAGTLGDLRVEPAYEYADEIIHHLTLQGKTRSEKFEKRDQFAPELIHFSHCVLNDAEPEPSAEEGMCDVRIVEAVLASARTRGPIHLPPYQRERRPTLEQALHRPPVSQQEPINAPGPSLR